MENFRQFKKASEIGPSPVGRPVLATDHPGEAIRMVGHQAQPDHPSPVLADKGNLL